MSESWGALLLAGERPGGDPFAAGEGVAAKALIPIAGQPMLAHPLAALLAVPAIGQVTILTQKPERLEGAIPGDARVRVERSGDTIAATLLALLDDPATRYPLLVTTADHALLTPAMVADFIGRASGDLALGVVERRALDARVPGTRRTWIGLQGGAYSGANLFALMGPKARRAVALWRGVEQDRKKGWRLLAALGLPGVLGLFRLRDLDGVMAGVGRRLGLDVSAVVMADPIAAIDVDKPADLALARTIMAERS